MKPVDIQREKNTYGVPVSFLLVHVLRWDSCIHLTSGRFGVVCKAKLTKFNDSSTDGQLVAVKMVRSKLTSIHADSDLLLGSLVVYISHMIQTCPPSRSYSLCSMRVF